MSGIESSGSDRWDEPVHDAEDLYSKAAMRWGGEAQMAKASEEFSELAAACARDLNGQQDPEELLEELADARIMLEQIAWHITDEALLDVSQEKLHQLDARLHGGDRNE